MLPPLLFLSAFYFLLSTFTLPTLAADPSPSLLQISGDVTDADGKPLFDAIVIIPSDPVAGKRGTFAATHIDSTGKFAFAKIDTTKSPSQKMLYAYLPGTGISQPAKFSTSPIHLQLAPSYDVQLTVLQEDGTPAAGVEMHPTIIHFYIDGWETGPVMYPSEEKPHAFSAVTDVEGKCILHGMPRDVVCYVDTDDPRFARLGLAGRILLRSEVPLAIAKPMTLAKATSISGRLVMENGQPEPGRTIVATSTEKDRRLCTSEAVTDANGNYTINQLAQDTYWVSIDSRKDGPTLWTAPGASVTTTIDKPVSLNFTLTHGALIKGQARDSFTGTPLANIDISLASRIAGRFLSTTDNDGHYEFRVPAGTHIPFLMTRRLQGYLETQEDYSKKVTVEEGQTAEFNFDFHPDTAPLIEGTIVDPAGKPVPNAWIGIDNPKADILETASSGYRMVWSDAEGHFRLHAMPGYLLRAGHNNLATPATITIVDEKPLEIKLSADAKFTLIVQFSDENGNPIPQASASLYIFETVQVGGSWDYHADAQGQIRIGPLRKDGKYSLRAIGDEYCPVKFGDLATVPQDSHELTIPLTLKKATAEIAGDVVDEEGKPFPNINVTYNASIGGSKETTTDAHGHFSFHVGEGEVGRIYPYRDHGVPPTLRTKAGDTALHLTLPKSAP